MLIMKRFLSQVSQQISQRLDEWQDSLETDSRLSVTDLRLPMPKGKKLGIRLDWGRGFKPHQGHCFVSLIKTHLSLLSTG